MASSSSIAGEVYVPLSLNQGVLAKCRSPLVSVLLQFSQHDQTGAKDAGCCISGTHEPFLIQYSLMRAFSNQSAAHETQATPKIMITVLSIGLAVSGKYCCGRVIDRQRLSRIAQLHRPALSAVWLRRCRPAPKPCGKGSVERSVVNLI